MANKTTRKGGVKSGKPAGRKTPGRASVRKSPVRATSKKIASARRLVKTTTARRATSTARGRDTAKVSSKKSSPSAKKPEKIALKKPVPKTLAGAISVDGKKRPRQTAAAAKPVSGKAAGAKLAAPAALAKGKHVPAKGRKEPGPATAADALNGATPDKDGYILFKGRRVRVISTKNVKKRRSLTATERAERAREATATGEPDKLIKTKLSKKELDHYRDQLLLLRSQKLGDLSAKEAEALQSNGGNLSHMPIHMADIGTDAYEQDFTLGLAESDRKLIREIDDALSRIENKTYGMCLLTGKPIPKSRLNAKPWAKYTIEAARMVENGQVA